LDESMPNSGFNCGEDEASSKSSSKGTPPGD
jgi:hypothetical protein